VFEVFVLAQLVFDAVTVGVLVWVALARRPRERAAPPPPAWAGEFATLARDVLETLEPVLDRLEAGARPPAAPDREAQRREALRWLRAGVAVEEVARRSGLLPGELRLLRNLASLGPAPGSR
jgi:hypothetical protein